MNAAFQLLTLLLQENTPTGTVGQGELVEIYLGGVLY